MFHERQSLLNETKWEWINDDRIVIYSWTRVKEFGTEMFSSLDKSLNHMHSKSKPEAVFIFLLLKKEQIKRRNGFLWREWIRPACYMPCQHTYTALQRQSVKIFPVEIFCSLPVFVVLFCIIHYSSLNVTRTLAHISS